MSSGPYGPIVMEHFMNPRNVGEIDGADGVGEVGNPACGDMMRLFLKVENNVVVDAKFRTFGCGAAIASSSMLTEMIKGKTLDEVRAISNQHVADALGGLPAVKMHCSVMAEEAVRSALDDYSKKHQATDPKTPVELIRMALEREKAAVVKYTEFAAQADDQNVRDLFLTLAADEKKHVALIQDEIEKETSPEN